MSQFQQRTYIFGNKGLGQHAPKHSFSCSECQSINRRESEGRGAPFAHAVLCSLCVTANWLCIHVVTVTTFSLSKSSSGSPIPVGAERHTSFPDSVTTARRLF